MCTHNENTHIIVFQRYYSYLYSRYCDSIHTIRADVFCELINSCYISFYRNDKKGHYGLLYFMTVYNKFAECSFVCSRYFYCKKIKQIHTVFTVFELQHTDCCVYNRPLVINVKVYFMVDKFSVG